MANIFLLVSLVILFYLIIAVYIFSFRKEQCKLCDKPLSRKDRNCGVGYANGKTFHYCAKCSNKLVNDIILNKGKEPAYLKEILNG